MALEITEPQSGFFSAGTIGVHLLGFAADESANGADIFGDGTVDRILHNFIGMFHPGIGGYSIGTQIEGFPVDHGLGDREPTA